MIFFTLISNICSVTVYQQQAPPNVPARGPAQTNAANQQPQQARVYPGDTQSPPHTATFPPQQRMVFTTMPGKITKSCDLCRVIIHHQ